MRSTRYKTSKTNLRVSPRSENAAHRRVAIINAALDEFSDKGFAAARVDDIARRAGVAKGTIYLNFEDKEALFEAIVKQEIGPVIAIAVSPLAPGESVRAFLDRTILPLLHDVARSRRGAVIRLLIAEAGRFPKLAEVYYRAVVEPGLTVFKKLIRQALRTGELEHDALARFPQLLMAPTILGIVWMALFDRFHPLDVEAMARAHFDQLFLTSLHSSKPRNGMQARGRAE